MFIKKSVVALLMVFALLLGAAGVILCARFGIADAILVQRDEYEEAQRYVKTYSKLEMIRDFLSANYYEDVKDDVLLDGAYRGMVSSMGDVYSEYYDAKEADDVMTSLTGEYSGVGMTFYGNDDGYLEVVKVFKGSPAEKAGMQSGDLILEADGVAYKGSESSDAASHIRGKAGTSVEIKYRRNGEDSTVTMVRANITQETVEYEMLEDGIGYIMIDSFEAKTSDEFKAALADITAQGAKAFIIDLRNNGGGLVMQARGVADQIMNRGTVVYTEDHDKNREFITTSNGRTSLPYVILVNQYTASASEILCAGVQDNKEGTIVGTQTYGKGIIQGLYPIGTDGAMIKLTYQQYYSPSGNKIHGVGITPDYVVELVSGDMTDYQLLKAIEVLTK